MHNISEYWKEIDLEFYLKYIEFASTLKKEDVEYYYHILSFLENKTYEEIKSLPVSLFNVYFERWKFLTEDILSISYEDNNPLLFLDGETYFIQKNFELLSFEQWQNIDSVIKLSDDDKNYLKNIHIILSIACQTRENYNYDKAIELSKVLLKEKMYYIIPNISFFLFNENLSLTDMISFLKKIQQQEILKSEAMLNSLQNFQKHGGGMGLLKRWLIMIYVGMMRYYLKQFKKSLLN